MKSNVLLKFGGYVAFASILSFSGLSAQAMLPTPEPEMNDPSSSTNAAVINQGQVNNVNPVDTKTVAALVSVDAQGQTILKPIDANTRLQPGSVIEYHTYVTNKSSDRMRSVKVTMSIPAQVKLIGELSPSSAFASIDGQNFNRMPLRGRIDGRLQDIPLEYYQHLRWTIEGLDINDTTVVKYRAVVR